MHNIYIIKNTENNKVYIGQTINSIEQRFKQHKGDAANGRRQSIHNAMLKYGCDKFYIEKLEEVPSRDADGREIYWINKYNSYYGGYNETIGGEGYSLFDFTDEEVVVKYEELRSLEDVAKHFGCSGATISRRLAKIGFNTRTLGSIQREENKIKEFNEQEIINTYLKIGSLVKTQAKFPGLGPVLLRKILDKHNIKHSKQTAKFKKVKAEKGLNSYEFESLTDAGQWLIDEGYSTAKLISVKNGISRALRRGNKNYRGFDWSYMS